MYFDPKNQQERITLASEVETLRIAGHTDHVIASRLGIDPARVQHWSEWAERNLARRRPQMSAEARDEEVARLNLWLSRLSDSYDEAILRATPDPNAETEPAPLPDIHKYIASIDRLSRRRSELLALNIAPRDNDNTSTRPSDEAIDTEYFALLSKLGKSASPDEGS